MYTLTISNVEPSPMHTFAEEPYFLTELVNGIAKPQGRRHADIAVARRLEATHTSPPHMHPFSILTFGIFVAGYTTARWDLVTRLYELAIFAWDHGVFVRKSWGDLCCIVLMHADSRRQRLRSALHCLHTPHIACCIRRDSRGESAFDA